jgi:hypothetical protein
MVTKRKRKRKQIRSKTPQKKAWTSAISKHLTTALPAAVYITREDLADLRDEIEEVLERAQQTTFLAERRSDSLLKEYDKMQRTEEKLLRNFNTMRAVFDLDKNPPPRNMRAEQVTWSYFHSWISRINARLEALEKKGKS